LLTRTIRNILTACLFSGCLLWSLPALSQNTAAAAAKPALWDFGMGMCAPCIQMEKVLAAIKGKYGDQIDVRLVMAEKEKPLFQQYKIMVVPTQVFLDANGKEVDRHMGFMPEEALVEKLKQLNFIK
jgi:thioredoxin 1